jgi:hypothetical protein
MWELGDREAVCSVVTFLGGLVLFWKQLVNVLLLLMIGISLLLLLRESLIVVCNFLKLCSCCEILIYRYVCTLVCQFWTVTNYTPWYPVGQGLAAQTLNGKFMCTGLWIPIICLHGGSEGSLQSSSDSLATYCLVFMVFMYL